MKSTSNNQKTEGAVKPVEKPGKVTSREIKPDMMESEKDEVKRAENKTTKRISKK